MPIVIGDIDYFGVPFPLVLADRYFHMPKTAFGFNLDVFRWDEVTKQHYYEVMYGRTVSDNINVNPNAIVNYKQITTSIFICKFKAKPEISQIGGYPTIDKEIWVKIDNTQIIVMIDNVKIASFSKNQVEGPIGLNINADGSYILGIGNLPDCMEIKRGYFIKQ